MKWSRILVAGIGTSVAVFLVITLAAARPPAEPGERRTATRGGAGM